VIQHKENAVIGLTWMVPDYDDEKAEPATFFESLPHDDIVRQRIRALRDSSHAAVANFVICASTGFHAGHISRTRGLISPLNP